MGSLAGLLLLIVVFPGGNHAAPRAPAREWVNAMGTPEAPLERKQPVAHRRCFEGRDQPRHRDMLARLL
jgi:hypothetical protein